MRASFFLPLLKGWPRANNDVVFLFFISLVKKLLLRPDAAIIDITTKCHAWKESEFLDGCTPFRRLHVNLSYVSVALGFKGAQFHKMLHHPPTTTASRTKEAEAETETSLIFFSIIVDINSGILFGSPWERFC